MKLAKGGVYIIERRKKGVTQTQTYKGDRFNIPKGWRVVRVVEETT
jgi:hypothetical protein